MKSIRPMFRVVFGAAVAACLAAAEPCSAQSNSQVPLGTNPNPVIWGGQKPNRQGREYRFSPPYSSYGYGYYAPGYGGLYGYDPWYYQGYIYPNGYASSGMYLPPGTVPPGEVFGPRVAKEFLAGAAPARATPRRADDPLEAPSGAERGTNAQSLARARNFIGYGDARFAKQEYSDAVDRYRSASRSAPQLADAWFRQGFAFIALGRYESAANSFRRGLKLDPGWVQTKFRLSELYGPDEGAKNAHRDALAQAAENNPNDADLLFLLGVHLYCDGQKERAAPFFERAKELSGSHAEHLRPFMAKLQADDPK